MPSRKQKRAASPARPGSAAATDAEADPPPSTAASATAVTAATAATRADAATPTTAVAPATRDGDTTAAVVTPTSKPVAKRRRLNASPPQPQPPQLAQPQSRAQPPSTCSLATADGEESASVVVGAAVVAATPRGRVTPPPVSCASTAAAAVASSAHAETATHPPAPTPSPTPATCGGDGGNIGGGLDASATVLLAERLTAELNASRPKRTLKPVKRFGAEAARSRVSEAISSSSDGESGEHSDSPSSSSDDSGDETHTADSDADFSETERPKKGKRQAESPAGESRSIGAPARSRSRKAQADGRPRRVAAGQGKFRCEYPGCGKVYAHNRNLESHRRLHTGVNIAPCYACGKKFTYPVFLAKHLSGHTDAEKQRHAEIERTKPPLVKLSRTKKPPGPRVRSSRSRPRSSSRRRSASKRAKPKPSTSPATVVARVSAESAATANEAKTDARQSPESIQRPAVVAVPHPTTGGKTRPRVPLPMESDVNSETEEERGSGTDESESRPPENQSHATESAQPMAGDTDAAAGGSSDGDSVPWLSSGNGIPNALDVPIPTKSPALIDFGAGLTDESAGGDSTADGLASPEGTGGSSGGSSGGSRSGDALDDMAGAGGLGDIPPVMPLTPVSTPLSTPLSAPLHPMNAELQAERFALSTLTEASTSDDVGGGMGFGPQSFPAAAPGLTFGGVPIPMQNGGFGPILSLSSMQPPALQPKYQLQESQPQSAPASFIDLETLTATGGAAAPRTDPLVPRQLFSFVPPSHLTAAASAAAAGAATVTGSSPGLSFRSLRDHTASPRVFTFVPRFPLKTEVDANALPSMATPMQALSLACTSPPALALSRD